MTEYRVFHSTLSIRERQIRESGAIKPGQPTCLHPKIFEQWSMTGYLPNISRTYVYLYGQMWEAKEGALATSETCLDEYTDDERVPIILEVRIFDEEIDSKMKRDTDCVSGLRYRGEIPIERILQVITLEAPNHVFRRHI